MRLLEYLTKSVTDLLPCAEADELFAVLDACGSERILAGILRMGPLRAHCLFAGPMLERGWSVAPYVVAADQELLDWIAKELWDEPWGVLILADCGIDRLRSHLRGLLYNQDEDDVPLYFRFYDPRVLSMFIPTCTRDQLVELFGPAKSFGVGKTEPGVFAFASLNVVASR